MTATQPFGTQPFSRATAPMPGGSVAAPIVSASTALLVTSDAVLREGLRKQLAEMRWTVLESAGGAEALMQLEQHAPAAILLDAWLPDLEAGEFTRQLRQLYPKLDVLHMDGTAAAGAPRSPRRHELLHALRAAQPDHASDGAAWNAAVPERVMAAVERTAQVDGGAHSAASSFSGQPMSVDSAQVAAPVFALPETVGDTPAMRELGRMVRLVAPRNATVLIEGETGTGKELVAKAVHRLSERAAKPFVVLNCAAIPEQLLEAELFGHTRGAFTGAVASRMGRIEAAHGGTLFLDEIGEMPLPLQAKMLRFLECGELQRIGDNDISRVDVRVVAATHQQLEQRAEAGTFRLDLYHRLAVFPVDVPALRDRMQDLPMLVQHILRKLGETMPKRSITAPAMETLAAHDWPGNVRELGHVLQRAAILSGDRAEIMAADIRLRRSVPARTAASPLCRAEMPRI